MRTTGVILASFGFIFLIAWTVVTFDDNSIRALSLQIAAAASFIGGCILWVGGTVVDRIKERKVGDRENNH